MWFAVDDDGTAWMSTYRKSQKAVNVRRNPKVALHIESGQTYDTLKGLLIRGDAESRRREEAVYQTIRRVRAKMPARSRTAPASKRPSAGRRASAWR